MYKIKRFSSVMPVRGLGIERYYSEYLEQREFNIFQDLYHSGPKRTYKKIVGRIRRSLGAGLERRLDKIADKQVASSLSSTRGEFQINNSKMREKLIGEANSMNAEVINGINKKNMLPKPNMASVIKSKNITKEDLEEIEEANKWLYKDAKDKVVSAINSGRDEIIFHRNKAGNETLAHEIGHMMNRRSKNPVNRKVSEIVTKTGLQEELGNLEGAKETGVKNSVKRYIQGKISQMEESNANREAIKLLKKHGASKEDIKKAKKSLDKGLESYKFTNEINYKSPIKNIVQIPSRRDLLPGDPGYGKNKVGSNIRLNRTKE